MTLTNAIFPFLLTSSLLCGAMTTNDFVSVTNDWRQGAYSCVHALAIHRYEMSSNDLVAAYLQYEWNSSFGTRSSISNSIEQILRASTLITNSAYATIYNNQVKGDVLFARDVLLPITSDDQLSADIPISMKPGKTMGFEFVLKILWDEHLW